MSNFSPVGSSDDDLSFEPERSSPHLDRPLLRVATQIALVFLCLAFILGTLVAAGRDPVFSPHGLAANGSSDAESTVRFHLLAGLGGALLATIAGALTVLLDERRWVRGIAIACLLLVLLQVGSRITPSSDYRAIGVSLVHPLSAQILLCALGLLSYAHSREFISRLNSMVMIVPSPLFAPALFVAGLVLLQLLSGAFMRISDAGLAVPDFPTTGGGLLPILSEARVFQSNQLRADLGLPPASLAQMVLHLAHRVGAFLVLVAGLVLGARVIQVHEFLASRARASAVLLVVGLLAQVLVGAFLMWSLLDPLALSLHLVLSAMVLYSSAMLAFKLRFQI